MTVDALKPGGPLKDPARFRVPRSQYGAMSQLARLYARDSHCYAFVGYVPCRSLRQLIVRLHRKHGVLCSPQEYYVRRMSGRSSGRLILAPRFQVRGVGEASVQFALVAATMPDAEPGMLRVLPDHDAPATSRLVWAERYQLALRSSGQVTWRLTDAEFKRLAGDLETAVHSGRVDQVHRVLRPLKTLPMFHGISADCYRLIRIAASRWAHRTRRRSGPSKAPGLDAREYLQSCRPRRGVGGVVYAPESDDAQQAIRTVGDLLRQCGDRAVAPDEVEA